MLLFLKANYKPHDLKLLNECQMFLEVITVADITVMDGSKIHSAVYQGERQESSLHNYKWPRHPPTLTHFHWSLWKEALQDTLMSPYSSANNPTLRQPLGRFLLDVAPTWTWHYHHARDRLFCQEKGSYVEYARANSTRSGRFYRQTPIAQPPNPLKLATIQHRPQFSGSPGLLHLQPPPFLQ